MQPRRRVLSGLDQPTAGEPTEQEHGVTTPNSASSRFPDTDSASGRMGGASASEFATHPPASDSEDSVATLMPDALSEDISSLHLSDEGTIARRASSASSTLPKLRLARAPSMTIFPVTVVRQHPGTSTEYGELQLLVTIGDKSISRTTIHDLGVRVDDVCADMSTYGYSVNPASDRPVTRSGEMAATPVQRDFWLAKNREWCSGIHRSISTAVAEYDLSPDPQISIGWMTSLQAQVKIDKRKSNRNLYGYETVQDVTIDFEPDMAWRARTGGWRSLGSKG
jgi:hypothetical protein